MSSDESRWHGILIELCVQITKNHPAHIGVRIDLAPTFGVIPALFLRIQTYPAIMYTRKKMLTWVDQPSQESTQWSGVSLREFLSHWLKSGTADTSKSPQNGEKEMRLIVGYHFSLHLYTLTHKWPASQQEGEQHSLAPRAQKPQHWREYISATHWYIRVVIVGVHWLHMRWTASGSCRKGVNQTKRSL
jgi:hypothetical protein